MFSKPNAFVYVHRTAVIVVDKHGAQAQLKLPEELFANMEVADSGKLLGLCQQFFTDHGMRHKRVLMVLGYNIVFEKKIALDESGEPKALTKAFVEAIPFEPEQRVCLSVRNDNSLRLFATNADIYTTIRDALDACDAAKIVAITPIAAYDLEGSERTLGVLAERFFKDAVTRKRANFASVN